MGLDKGLGGVLVAFAVGALVTAASARFTFAGIGTREVTAVEEAQCRWVAERLVAAGGWLYSGNAEGADIAFQRGAGKRSTAWLPWAGFNCGDGPDEYQAGERCGDVVVAGDFAPGLLALELHPLVRDRRRLDGDFTTPAPSMFRRGAVSLLARDAAQVLGDEAHPQVDVVFCCATPAGLGANVAGGTGQAVRVAIERGIPVVNLRKKGWQAELEAGIAHYLETSHG